MFNLVFGFQLRAPLSGSPSRNRAAAKELSKLSTILFQIVRVDVQDDAVDILNSKGLLTCSGTSPHQGSTMTQNPCLAQNRA